MRKALAWTLALLLLLPAPTWSANGDVIAVDNIAGALQRTWKMLDAVDASSNGQWIKFEGFTQGTLDVSGINGDTLQVYGSNAATIPDNSTDGNQVGDDITADGHTTIVGPYRWLKVKASIVGGTVTALLNATSSGGGATGGATSSVTISGTATVQGEHASNSADVSDKVGVLPAIVGASPPSLTDGRQAALSIDDAGNLRVIVEDNGASVDYYPGTGAANQDSQQIKASAGTLYAATCTSIDTTVVYVKLYEDAAPTSADTVKMKLALSGAPTAGTVGGGHFNFGPDGIAFATAMGSRFTTGFADNDTNAVTTGEVICHFVYR